MARRPAARITLGARGRVWLDVELFGTWVEVRVLPPADEPDPPPERYSTGFAQVELAGPTPEPVTFGFRRSDPEEGVPWPP